MSLLPVRHEVRILDRGEIERRRLIVAELRWIKGRMTVPEIVSALGKLNPPIVVSLRTVERDIVAIRDDSRRYLTANRFDARLEISMSLMRYEMLARKGDGSRTLVE